MADFTVLGLCGSLRRASFNMAALRAAQELAPQGITVQIADLSEFPLYSDDVRLAGYPPAVAAVREAGRRAGGPPVGPPGENKFSSPGVHEAPRPVPPGPPTT